MAAYLVSIVNDITDIEQYKRYRAALPAARSEKAIYRVLPADVELLEGDMPVQFGVIAEFESREDARQWYYGEAYQTAKALRAGIARVQTMIFEGVSPPNI